MFGKTHLFYGILNKEKRTLWDKIPAPSCPVLEGGPLVMLRKGKKGVLSNLIVEDLDEVGHLGG